MSTIVTRAGKGAPLTNAELDANFTNLDTDKLEAGDALGTPASVTLTNATGLPTAGLVDNAVTDPKLRDSAALSVIGRGANSTGDPADIVAGTNKQVLRRDGSSLAFGAVDLSSNQAVTGTLPVNQGGTGITSFGTGVAAFLGTPSSANLAAALTDETGTGAAVFATNATLVTPALGTPASGVATNLTGTASGLTAGNVTTNANLTGAITSTGNATLLGSFSSANLAAAVTDETGTGALVFATSPTLVTPALGTPASGVVTNLTGTASININGTVGAATPAAGAFTTLSATSPTSFAAGTAALPAITRTGDTNTGLFFPAADTLAASTAGSERLRINSSGNVGIGTSAPAARLTVTGGGDNVNGQLRVVAEGAGADAQISFGTPLNGRGMYVDDSDTNKFKIYTGAGKGAAGEFTIDNVGNVGIGTTAPTALLHLAKANAAADLFLKRTDSSNSGVLANIRFGMGAGESVESGLIQLERVGSQGSNDSRGSTMSFWTKTDAASPVLTRALHINNIQNIGIGTTTPDANLTVNGAASFAAGSAAAPSIARSGDLNTGLFFPAADTIAASTAGTEKMRLSAAGGLSVGTTVDAGANNLRVAGTINSGGTRLMPGLNTTTSVTAGPTTIFSVAAGIPLCVVSGSASGGLVFLDLVAYTPSGGFVVISSSTVNGAPDARTYSVSGNNLQLSMAAGTYTVGVAAITGSF